MDPTITAETDELAPGFEAENNSGDALDVKNNFKSLNYRS
jgi:hypothetical protein